MMVFAFLATARALSLRPAFSASRRGLAKRSGGRRAATVEQASPEAVEDEDRYRGTVLLPETSFGQRANAINKEPELQKFWADTKVYERLWADAQAPCAGRAALGPAAGACSAAVAVERAIC